MKPDVAERRKAILSHIKSENALRDLKYLHSLHQTSHDERVSISQNKTTFRSPSPGEWLQRENCDSSAQPSQFVIPDIIHRSTSSPHVKAPKSIVKRTRYPTIPNNEPTAEDRRTDFEAWCEEVARAREEEGFRSTKPLADNRTAAPAQPKKVELLAPVRVSAGKSFGRTKRDDLEDGSTTLNQVQQSPLGNPGPAVTNRRPHRPQPNVVEKDLGVTPSRDLARALAKTMFGEWLHKDSHDPKLWDSRTLTDMWNPLPVRSALEPASIRGPGTPQKRWVWLAPFERKLMWNRSSFLPGLSGFRGENSNVRKGAHSYSPSVIVTR